MITWHLKKTDNNLEGFKVSRILYLLRLSSFLVTSLFFLGNGTPGHIVGKIFIICCVGIASVLLNHLYVNNLHALRVVYLLLFIEISFNTLILIPSGGMDSPYIWYSMNTILISSLLLKKRIFCWLNLFIYLICSTCLMSAIFDIQLSNILLGKSNFLLSLILITAAVQILVTYNKEIEDKNYSLNEANRKIKEYMDSAMQLYKAVHFLTNQSDEKSLLNLILEYAIKITKSEKAFFLKREKQNGSLVVSHKTLNEEEEKIFKDQTARMVSKITNLESMSCFEFENQYWMVMPVKCHSEVFGVIGIQSEKNLDKVDGNDIVHRLTFLADLGTISLERFNIEDLYAKLLLKQEQNRIANEIHDGVLQKLFIISCGITLLTKRSCTISREKIVPELNMIRSSLNDAMGDLRSVIYGYSWGQKGADDFLLDIQHIINSTKKYNNLDIDFNLSGNLELLSLEHKKAFYRIISEGISNSIRHGNAMNISIDLDIDLMEASLVIADNGDGFDVNKLVKKDKSGIGIYNIKFLVESFQGVISIISEIGKGTTLFIRVPFYKKGIGSEMYCENTSCR